MKLLKFLVCPSSKKKMSMATSSIILKINELIEKKQCYTIDKTPITKKISQALWQKQSKKVYIIEDEVPILIIEKAIVIESL